jgi:hypothetical protein
MLLSMPLVVMVCHLLSSIYHSNQRLGHALSCEERLREEFWHRLWFGYPGDCNLIASTKI